PGSAAVWPQRRGAGSGTLASRAGSTLSGAVWNHTPKFIAGCIFLVGCSAATCPPVARDGLIANAPGPSVNDDLIEFRLLAAILPGEPGSWFPGAWWNEWVVEIRN